MATNIRIERRRNEPVEKLIRRFIKKCKKEKIIDIYREKTEYYTKPSIIKRRAKNKAIRDQQKKQKQIDELFI